MLGGLVGGNAGGMAMPGLQRAGYDTGGMQQRARQAALMQMAASLSQAGGWSDTPQSLGTAFGRGMQGAQGAYGNALAQELEFAKMARDEEEYYAKAKREEALSKVFDDPEMLARIPEELRTILPFLDNQGRVALLGESIKARAAGIKPLETREVKIGPEIVTQQFDPRSGEWSELARGARFAPPATTNINTVDPNALPLEIAKFEQGLAGDWEKVSRPAGEAVRVHQTISRGLATGNGVGDLAAIYGFVKSLDPGSVVREGEIDLVNSASSIINQMQTISGRAKTGSLMTPESRMKLQVLSDQLLTVSRESYERGQKQYRSRLDSFKTRGLNIDPGAVMTDQVGFPQTGTQQLQQGTNEMLQRLRGSPFARLFGGGQ